jgi:hypothetical protein
LQLAKPYAYGSADCFFTGLAVIDAVQGTDHRSTYADRYTTLIGAQRALRKEGHDSLVSFFATLVEKIAPAMAHLGDLGIVSLPVEGSKRMAEHVGVHDGRMFVVKTEDGVKRFPFTAAIAAFRV